MKSIALKAAAKINLSLRVLRKREDGFHEIDTTIVKLPGLADEMTLQEADAFSFHCDDASIPSDASNLVVKAKDAYEKAVRKLIHCAIHLKKNIPHGAGLGGGSSDAAATLLGLNQLNDHALTVDQLIDLAASLGSDIPFFMTAGASRCTGRGEIIEPVAQPPKLPILLLKPAFSVATPDAYRRWEGSSELSRIHYQSQEVSGIRFVNDLEKPVFYKHRFLAEMKQWLLERKETAAALMSGSGSTMFAILKDPADAEKLAKAARHELDQNLWHWSGYTEG